MLSHENVPTTPSKRVPPVPLNVKTSSDNAPPPRTPPAQVRSVGRSKGASKALSSRPAHRETFLDDITPVDKARDGGQDYQDQKDLHDLSLSPRHVARSSVVDNMLLSLDQFSGHGDGVSEVDDDPYAVNSRYASSKNNARSRGHKYSTSYSSDYDAFVDDSSSRYSSHYSRGRRSNSSSSYQRALPIINSAGLENEAFMPRPRIPKAQRAPTPSEQAVSKHSRGAKKGSKGSGSSSFDFGQMIGSSAWQRSIDQRSNSFDHGYSKGAKLVPQPTFTAPLNINTAPIQTLDYDFEAAPTPTVPAGPRRARSPPPAVVFPSQPMQPTPQSPVTARTNSKHSKDTFGWKGWSDKSALPSLRPSREDTNGIRGLTSVITCPSSSAPSPTINYHKPSIVSISGSTPPVKERPGFFRRVFGSSKSTVQTNDMRPPQLPPMNLPSSGGGERSERQGNHGYSQNVHAKLSKPPPTRDPPAVPPKATGQPSLNKKPSLFFRRRKKSLTGIESPAILPVHMQAEAADSNARNMGDRDSVSSLRKVMNPYLHSPVMSPQEFHDSIERQEVGPEEMENDNKPATDVARKLSVADPSTSRIRGEQNNIAMSSVRGVTSAPRESPNAGEQPNIDIARRDDHEKSFLQDSSDNDGKSSRTDINDPGLPLVYSTENRKLSSTDDEPTSARDIKPENEKPQDLEVTAELAVEALGMKAKDDSRDQSPKTPYALRRNLSPQSAAGAVVDDDEWVVTPSRLKDGKLSPRNSSGKSSRVWIRPTASEEQLKDARKLSLPGEGTQDSARASGSSISDYTSAKSLPVVQVDDKADVKADKGVVNKDDLGDPAEPDTNYHDQARKIYDGDEAFMSKAKAAAWLGESGPERGQVRKAYMELFDWTDLNILTALRGFCGKLMMKGETQQVDRILDAFSTRWCECNPNHGFKATGKPAIKSL